MTQVGIKCVKWTTLQILPNNLKRSCFVATGALNMLRPCLFIVPSLAPARTKLRQRFPLPFMYANSNTAMKCTCKVKVKRQTIMITVISKPHTVQLKIILPAIHFSNKSNTNIAKYAPQVKLRGTFSLAI